MAQDNEAEKKPDPKTTKERLKDLLWTPAIITALVSVFAYVGAYLCEIAYCNYFGIPRDLIVVNWERYCENLPLVVMLAVAMIVVPIAVVWLEEKTRYIRIKASLACLLTKLKGLACSMKKAGNICLMHFISWTANNHCIQDMKSAVARLWAKLSCVVEWIIKVKDGRKKLVEFCSQTEIATDIISSLIAFLAAFVLTLPILWFYQVGLSGYKWQWSLVYICVCLGIVAVAYTFGIRGYSRGKWRQRMITVLSLLFILFTFVFYFTAGINGARGDISYYVQSFPNNPSIEDLSVSELYAQNQNAQSLSEQNLVVLRIYGDKAICTPWYRQGNESYITDNRSFVIYPLDSITLTPKEIGPLKKLQ